MQDNYLSCSAYSGHTVDANGFAKFEKDGEFYFSFIENGQVILRSEGYASEKSRDNGIASVQKNMDTEERYRTSQQADGTWVLALKAANHQEIATSCPVATEADAFNFLPTKRAALLAASSVKSADTSGSAKSTNPEDNYLVCDEYAKHIGSKSAKHADFISFQHANGQFYFAWVSGSTIVMRSEGYTTEVNRDKGIDSVLKNRDDKARMSNETAHGAHFLVLKAGNNQEIARSCPKKSADEVNGLLALGAAAVTASAISTPKVEAKTTTTTTNTTTTNTTANNLSSAGTTSHTSNGNTNSEEECENCWSRLWPLLALLALGALLWMFMQKSCMAPKAEVPAVNTTIVAADTFDAEALAAKAGWDSLLGKTVEVKLPDGTSIMVPENGSEKKLVEYLMGDCPTDMETSWFNMDRVLFKTGSSELNAVSMDQLGTIAKIFNAFKTSKFKIGGYTDNVGSEDLNIKLSGDRAASAMNAIVGMNVDATRVRSKGFGPKHPECPANDTDACKAKNRRVAIQVEQCK